MGTLAQISDSVEAYDRHVDEQVRRARSDERFRAELLARWEQVRRSVPTVTTPTGIPLPRLALPQTDEPGEVARYLFGEGLPGEFPFTNAAYREMYLEQPGGQPAEEPSRLFAGLGLAEDTNARFHFLTKQQRTSPRAPRSTGRRFTAWTATGRFAVEATASSGRSARGAWRSTPSRTWSGCTTASRSTTRPFPPR